MTFQLESVAHFRQWDESQWCLFFKSYTPQSDPRELHNLVNSREFQDAMMTVGVFGSTKLFVQTPCVWEREASWQSWNEKNLSKISCLAIRMLVMPERSLQEDVEGNENLFERVVIKSNEDDREPLMFEREGYAVWMGPWAGLSGVRLNEMRYVFGASSLLYGETFSVGESFAQAREAFVRENARQAHIKDLLEPLLFPPVADLVCDYSSNLLVDRRAPEKRELSILTCRTFKARPSPYEAGNIYLYRLSPLREALRTISECISDYVGDSEQEILT